MPEDPTPLLDYAPAPKPMSRTRLALLVGGLGSATFLIAGSVYHLKTAPPPMLIGDMAAPATRFSPATQPTSPALPGGIASPTTQWTPAERAASESE